MNTGTIVQVSGPVVDVEFAAGSLPKIREALSVDLGRAAAVMEVSQHMAHDTVRCIMLAESEGLARGMQVCAPGETITVPVGDITLGRMFNVLGEPIDGGDPSPPRRSATASTASPRPSRSSAPSARFWRPASRSSTCWSPTPRAAKSACSAAPAWARPC